ncbi:hypothetical protein ACVCNH_20500 [Achromobacter anxifer]
MSVIDPVLATLIVGSAPAGPLREKRKRYPERRGADLTLIKRCNIFASMWAATLASLHTSMRHVVIHQTVARRPHAA